MILVGAPPEEEVEYLQLRSVCVIGSDGNRRWIWRPEALASLAQTHPEVIAQLGG